MTDYGSLFANLIEDEVTQATSSKVSTRKTAGRTFNENVDFDSYFDSLLEDFVSEETVMVEQQVYQEPIVEEHQETITEEVIEEDVIQTPQQPVMGMMDDLTNKLSTYLTRTNTKYVEPDPQDFSVVVENLQRQIQDVRRLVLENTVVSGIGQGGDGQGPGSGEVWFKRLDDVDMDGLEPGDSIIWDGNKWRPQKHCYSVDGGLSNQSVYEYYLDAHRGSNLPNQNLNGDADGGSAAPNDCDLNYELRNSIGQVNQVLTDLSSKAIIIEG